MRLGGGPPSPPPSQHTHTHTPAHTHTHTHNWQQVCGDADENKTNLPLTIIKKIIGTGFLLNKTVIVLLLLLFANLPPYPRSLGLSNRQWHSCAVSQSQSLSVPLTYKNFTNTGITTIFLAQPNMAVFPLPLTISAAFIKNLLNPTETIETNRHANLPFVFLEVCE